MFQPNPAPQPDRHSTSPHASLFQTQDAVTAEYHLRIGKSLYQSYQARSRQQDLEEAIQHFQKAVEMEPDLAEAYVQLASALWDQGTINLELAQFYCETALKLDPTQSEANLFLGYFLQRAGFLEDAIQQYRLAIGKSFRRSGRPHIALGHSLLKQSLQATGTLQQLSLAIQGIGHFTAGCSLLPLDLQTCQLLKDALLTDAQIYTLTGLASLCKTLKLHGCAKQVYALGIGLMPKEALFYHLLGDYFLYEQNDAQQAIPYYQEAQAVEPNNLALLKKLGKAYAEVRDLPNAVSILTTVAEKDTEDFDTLYNLGQLYTDEKAYFKALYYFKEAARIRPHSPYVHSNMAYVLFKLDDIDGAFEEYTIAMEFGTDPTWLSTVSQTLGIIACQVYRNPSQAVEYLQQSLHYNPENQETLAFLADIYFETGQMELAISAYKSILQFDPKNTDCYSNIGYILWQMDRNEEAIDAYMTAIYYDARNHVAHNNLGVIYLDEYGNAEKALSLFETALKLKPDYTLACFNLGRTLEKLGKTLDAAEHYSKALQLNQVNQELEDTEIQDYLDHLFD